MNKSSWSATLSCISLNDATGLEFIIHPTLYVYYCPLDSTYVAAMRDFDNFTPTKTIRLTNEMENQ